MVEFNANYEDRDEINSINESIKGEGGAYFDKGKKKWCLSNEANYKKYAKWISAETLKELDLKYSGESVVENKVLSDLLKDVSGNLKLQKKKYQTEGDVVEAYECKDQYKDQSQIICKLNDCHDYKRPITVKIPLAWPEEDEKNQKNLKDELLKGCRIRVEVEPFISTTKANIQFKALKKPIILGPISRVTEMQQLKDKLAAELGHDELLRKDFRDIAWNENFTQIALITGRSTKAYVDFMKEFIKYNDESIVKFCDTKMKPENIINAIAEQNRQGDCQYICIVRGGGDEEEMFANFSNNGALVEAIRNSKIPVILGIGHKEDEFLVDFVALYAAGTPTSAAAVFNRIKASANNKKKRTETAKKIEDLRKNSISKDTDYNNLLSNMVELTKENDELKSRVEELEVENNELERQNNELERQLQRQGKGFLGRIKGLFS